MNDKITVQFKGCDEKFDVRLQQQEPFKIYETTPIGTMTDYTRLTNLPTINGVTVIGDLTSDDLHLSGMFKYDTRAGWAQKADYVPEAGEIILYSDKEVIEETTFAGIKVGDGNAYVADLPFVGDDVAVKMFLLFQGHINNTEVHTSLQEKAFWNNKLNCNLVGETLIFNTL